MPIHWPVSRRWLGLFVVLSILGAAQARATVCAGGGALPAGWSDLDVGSNPTPGCASYDSSTGTFRVDGAGSGTFLTTTDSFHYAYRSFTGNFVFVARLLDVSNVGAPYGGLMVRLATTAGSRNI